LSSTTTTAATTNDEQNKTCDNFLTRISGCLVAIAVKLKEYKAGGGGVSVSIGV